VLLRFDPFRELDRLTEQATRAPQPLPMDAVRRGDDVIVAFDLPGVEPASIDLTVERNVLTVRATRRPLKAEGDQVIAAERRSGAVARQLLLGDTLDGDSVRADYADGVLTLTIAAAEAAKPRKVEVSTAQPGPSAPEAIEATAAEADAA
jgi:HSP20 family protein